MKSQKSAVNNSIPFTPPSNDVLDQEADLRAYNAMKARIRAVDASTVRPMTLNPYDAVAVVLAREPDLRRLVGVYSDDGAIALEAVHVDEAVTAARAVRYLASVVDAKRRGPTVVTAQAGEAVTVRDRLVRWIDIGISEKKLDAGARVVSANSRGYATIGKDIMKAARVLILAWDDMEGFVPFTRAELADAYEIGAAMSTMAVDRATGHDAAVDESAPLVVERDAAIELLHRAWLPVQRRVNYTRFVEGDVERYASSLYTRTVRTRRTVATPAVPAGTDTATATATATEEPGAGP